MADPCDDAGPPLVSAGAMTTIARPSLAARLNAAVYDPVLSLGERRGMARRRASILAAARGRVLEIGAGTGLNAASYPAGLDELVLAEPDAGMARLLERRVASTPPASPARVVLAPAEELPFADASFDTVVSTMVLCTVPDVHDALDEIRRVLRPDGQLLFIEHVRDAGGRLSRWQDRLNAPWRVYASGCNCNRDTVAELGHAFELHDIRRERWSGMPRIVHPLVLGRALPAA